MQDHNMVSPLLDNTLAVVLLAIAMVSVLLPYEVVQYRRRGYTYRRVRGIMWKWEQTPSRVQLHIAGVLQLQIALLKLVQWFCRQYQDRLWAGMRELLKRWLV